MKEQLTLRLQEIWDNDPFVVNNEGLPSWELLDRDVRQAILNVVSRALEDPVELILYCPACGERHVDEGDQATKPHRTHACQECGFLWAPAVVPTVGVRFLPGCKT